MSLEGEAGEGEEGNWSQVAFQVVLIGGGILEKTWNKHISVFAVNQQFHLWKL